MCESYGVQLRLTLYGTTSTSTVGLKEQGMLPEDDRMIEICRSVLSVLM